MALSCTVYRCARQPEMYLYLRAGVGPDALPDTLRRHTGVLTAVMNLALDPSRRLARADTGKVIEALEKEGWYLQMPPTIHGHLHDGD